MSARAMLPAPIIAILWLLPESFMAAILTRPACDAVFRTWRNRPRRALFARTEQRATHAHHGRSLVYGHLQVAGHAHGEGVDAGVAGLQRLEQRAHSGKCRARLRR